MKYLGCSLDKNRSEKSMTLKVISKFNNRLILASAPFCPFMFSLGS